MLTKKRKISNFLNTLLVAVLAVLMLFGSVINANTVWAEEEEDPKVVTTGPKAGNPSDVSVSNVHTPEVKTGETAVIGFDVNLNLNPNEYLLSKIYVKDSTSTAFVADEGLNAVNYMFGSNWRCDFFFNTKMDITTGYYPITYVIEYVKVKAEDGSIEETYYVEKSLDIYVKGKDEKDTTDEVTSVPRIIVTGFETNPEKVMAGQEFELTVHLQNTSNVTAVSNVKITLSSTDNVFLPSSGSSTEFIRSIGCGATKDIVMKMKAQASLEQKPYVLTVDCEYEGEKNAPYKASESISVPVYQEAKAKITDVEVMPGSLELYGQANVMFSINNTGKSTLYNVQVSVDPSCTTIESEDSFVGNINPGSTGYADFMVTGIAPTTDDGKVKIIISYEDAGGEIGTFETEVELFVFEPMMEDLPMDDVGMMEDPGMIEEKPSNSWIWILVGAVVVIVVIIVTVVLIKKAKKKALEKELSDEIS